MFVPYNVDVPMVRLPWMNWILIAVTSIISITILTGKWPTTKKHVVAVEQIDKALDPNNPNAERDVKHLMLELQESLREPPPLALRPDDFSIQQLISHLFVHGDALHLLGNMVFLFCFGNAVNAKLGHLLFLGLYLGLGVLAGLGWLLFGSAIPVVGASGAINGIVGIFLVLYPRNDVQVFYGILPLGIGVYEVASAWIISLFLCLDIVGLCFDRHGQIGYVAHVVGLLGGVAVAISLLSFRVIRSTSYEENLLQMVGLQEKRRRRSVSESKPRKKRIRRQADKTRRQMD
jgi:membrane associated rhomboid family serine protease